MKKKNKLYKTVNENDGLDASNSYAVLGGMNGVNIGVFSEKTDYAFLDPETTYEMVCDYTLRKGKPFPVTLKELEKQLIAEGTIEIIQKSATKRMWKIPIKAISMFTPNGIPLTRVPKVK